MNITGEHQQRALEFIPMHVQSQRANGRSRNTVSLAFSRQNRLNVLSASSPFPKTAEQSEGVCIHTCACVCVCICTYVQKGSSPPSLIPPCKHCNCFLFYRLLEWSLPWSSSWPSWRLESFSVSFPKYVENLFLPFSRHIYDSAWPFMAIQMSAICI